MLPADRIEERKVLATGSAVEMGERYIFYTLQSLLLLYLLEQLHLPHALSAKLAGTVFGMVYISALLGGYIAEHLLTYYRAVFIGSIVLILGAFMMTSVNSEHTLFVGLALISIGSGLVKSNVASFIGRFYDRVNAPESQRDFGFNIFYIGINLGSVFATFFAMSLRNAFGFGPTFYVSFVVAIVLSLMVACGFFYLRKSRGNTKVPLRSFALAILLIVAYIAFVFYILQHLIIANWIFTLSALACVVTLLMSARGHQTRRVIAALIFFVLSVLYWCLYMQLYLALLLFIQHCVSHHFLGLPINTTQFLSAESIFILLLGVFMGKLWIAREKRNKAVHDIDKFSAAFFIIGLMFVLFYVAIMLSPLAAKIPAWVIIAGVFLMAVSELALSAIGLSMVTKIAPKGYVSLYMGIWLVTLGLGSRLAGQVASFIDVNKNMMDAKIAMSHGLVWFIVMSAAGVVGGIAFRKLAILKREN